MKLFGTDGIRGRVGEFPITPSDMKKLGYAISKSIFKDKAGLVLISNDGRASADEIEDALREGISKQGAHIASLDLLSTPALSYFVRNIQVTEVKDNSKIPIVKLAKKIFPTSVPDQKFDKDKWKQIINSLRTFILFKRIIVLYFMG